MNVIDLPEVLRFFKGLKTSPAKIIDAEKRYIWFSEILKTEPALSSQYLRWKNYPLSFRPMERIRFFAYIKKHIFNIVCLYFIFKLRYKIYVFGKIFSIEVRSAKNATPSYIIDRDACRAILLVNNLSEAHQLFMDITKAHFKEKLGYIGKSRRLRARIVLHIIKYGKRCWGYCKPVSNAWELGFKWQIIFGDEFHQEYLLCHELAHLKVGNHGKKFWQYTSELLGRDSIEADRQFSLSNEKFIWICNP